MAKEIVTRTSLSVVVLERGLHCKLADYAAGMNELDYHNIAGRIRSEIF